MDNVIIRAAGLVFLGRTKSLGGFCDSGFNGFFCVTDEVVVIASIPVLAIGPFDFAFDLVVLGAIASAPKINDLCVFC